MGLRASIQELHASTALRNKRDREHTKALDACTAAVNKLSGVEVSS